MCVCLCVWETQREVERERGREGEKVRESKWERERERENEWKSAGERVRHREWERERERERREGERDRVREEWNMTDRHWFTFQYMIKWELLTHINVCQRYKICITGWLKQMSVC